MNSFLKWNSMVESSKFVFQLHLAANDEEKKRKNRKNKEKKHFLYLTLKSGKKTRIDAKQFRFLCLARETWFEGKHGLFCSK